MTPFNIQLLVILFVLAAAIYFALQTRYKAHIASFILELIRDAEEEYGPKTGPSKKQYVALAIYEMLPDLAKMVIPARVFSRMIDDASDLFEQYLEDLEDEEVEALIG